MGFFFIGKAMENLWSIQFPQVFCRNKVQSWILWDTQTTVKDGGLTPTRLSLLFFSLWFLFFWVFGKVQCIVEK